MLKEIDCPREDRFLPIIAMGSEDILPSKDSINKFIKGNKNIDRSVINEFIDWVKSDNEIIAYCGYGYCDAKIPKTYNCLFDSADLGKPIDLKASVRFAIWNGLFPTAKLDHGHKTICIISFDNGIPLKLKELPNWDDLQEGNYQYNKFGLCDKNDYKFISKQIKILLKKPKLH